LATDAFEEFGTEWANEAWAELEKREEKRQGKRQRGEQWREMNKKRR